MRNIHLLRGLQSVTECHPQTRDIGGKRMVVDALNFTPPFAALSARREPVQADVYWSARRCAKTRGRGANRTEVQKSRSLSTIQQTCDLP